MELTLDQALQKGIEAHKAGKAQEADKYYTAILKANPKHPDANHNMGVLAVGVGKVEEALPFFKTALEVNSSIAQFWLSYIDALIKLNRITDAKAVLDQAKSNGAKGDGFEKLDKQLAGRGNKQEPPQKQLQPLINLYTQGQHQDALIQASELLNKFPNSVDLHNIVGVANKGLGNLKEAIEAYNKAISIKPDYAVAYNNMGLILQEQAKLEEAIEAYNKALAIKPDYPEAFNNMGITFQEQGKLEEAIQAYNKALAIKPDIADAYNNLGSALKDQGKLDEAINIIKKALSIRPDYAEAYNNMGITFQEQGKLEEAIQAYNKALAIKPDFAEAYDNTGNTLQEQGKLDEAIKAYKKALAIKPDYAEAYNNMGNALKEQGKLEEALNAFNQAITLDPDLQSSFSSYLHQAASMCDWQKYEPRVLRKYLAKSTSDKIKHPMSPFPFLHLDPSPDTQLRISKLFSANTFKKNQLLPIIKRPKLKPERLRIGYFSPDFKDHPVAQMIESVFRHHDRSKFEIFAYSFGKSLDGVMGQKIKSAADTLRNVQSLSGPDIAVLAKEDQINIAIDLAGYTRSNKAEIFNSRPAPIQINYLGYPSTMGTKFMNYIIADKVLIPPEMESYYSEKIIFMPDSYQPVNDSLVVAKVIPTKEELGLPKSGFVFCAINQAYKIKPKEFDIWMRLLSKVEGSVLWLKSENKWMVENLQSEAHKRGIEPSRLIFAERIAHEQYLAQFKQADLYLDTFNYNAGTTASDVLMAGLPIVTKMGDTYASRMAASLLNAAGMRELITKTVKEYEDLALELALNSSKLCKLRERLQKNLKTAPILNAELYTRNLEAGYQQAYDNYYYLNSVQNIDVTPSLSSEYTEVYK